MFQENSYRVVPQDEETNEGFLFTDGKQINVKYQRHHHDRDCWTIRES